MEAVKIIRILCRCPQCKGENKLVLDWNSPRRTTKCQACGEIIPTGAYTVLLASSDQRQPIF